MFHPFLTHIGFSFIVALLGSDGAYIRVFLSDEAFRGS